MEKNEKNVSGTPFVVLFVGVVFIEAFFHGGDFFGPYGIGMRIILDCAVFAVLGIFLGDIIFRKKD